MVAKTKVEFEYDEEADVLYISLGTGEPSYSEEVDDILVVDKGFFSHQITGFRLIGVRFHKIEVEVVLQETIPKAFEQERTEIQSILGDREKIHSALLGKIQKGLPREIGITA